MVRSSPKTGFALLSGAAGTSAATHPTGEHAGIRGCHADNHIARAKVPSRDGGLAPAAPGCFQSRSEYLIGPNEPQPTDAARAQAATERATLKATASQSQKSRGRWYRIGLLSCDSETIRACRVRSAEMRHLSQMPGIVVNEGLPLPG